MLGDGDGTKAPRGRPSLDSVGEVRGQRSTTGTPETPCREDGKDQRASLVGEKGERTATRRRGAHGRRRGFASGDGHGSELAAAGNRSPARTRGRITASSFSPSDVFRHNFLEAPLRVRARCCARKLRCPERRGAEEGRRECPIRPVPPRFRCLAGLGSSPIGPSRAQHTGLRALARGWPPSHTRPPTTRHPGAIPMGNKPCEGLAGPGLDPLPASSPSAGKVTLSLAPCHDRHATESLIFNVGMGSVVNDIQCVLFPVLLLAWDRPCSRTGRIELEIGCILPRWARRSRRRAASTRPVVFFCGPEPELRLCNAQQRKQRSVVVDWCSAELAVGRATRYKGPPSDSRAKQAKKEAESIHLYSYETRSLIHHTAVREFLRQTTVASPDRPPKGFIHASQTANDSAARPRTVPRSPHFHCPGTRSARTRPSFLHSMNGWPGIARGWTSDEHARAVQGPDDFLKGRLLRLTMDRLLTRCTTTSISYEAVRCKGRRSSLAQSRAPIRSGPARRAPEEEEEEVMATGRGQVGATGLCPDEESQVACSGPQLARPSKAPPPLLHRKRRQQWTPATA